MKSTKENQFIWNSVYTFAFYNLKIGRAGLYWSCDTKEDKNRYFSHVFSFCLVSSTVLIEALKKQFMKKKKKKRSNLVNAYVHFVHYVWGFP